MIKKTYLMRTARRSAPIDASVFRFTAIPEFTRRNTPLIAGLVVNAISPDRARIVTSSICYGSVTDPPSPPPSFPNANISVCRRMPIKLQSNNDAPIFHGVKDVECGDFRNDILLRIRRGKYSRELSNAIWKITALISGKASLMTVRSSADGRKFEAREPERRGGIARGRRRAIEKCASAHVLITRCESNRVYQSRVGPNFDDPNFRNE